MWQLSPEQAKVVEDLEEFDGKFLDDLVKAADLGEVSNDNSGVNSVVEALSALIAIDDSESTIIPDKQMFEQNALISYEKEANKLLNELEASRRFLLDLIQKYEGVSHKTSSLHEACDKLMSDQTALTTVAEEMRHRLTYFDRIDQISHKLQSPLLSVTGESFMQILISIDETMTFLNNNPNYKETSVYLEKSQQCLAKALNRVKQHVYSLINKATENTTGSSKIDDTFTLFYGLFGTHAPNIKSLMENLEKKRHDSEEYASLLDDCYGYYFEKREQLISSSVRTSIEQLRKTHSGSCLLVRSGCSLLLRFCDDEFHLYNRFFTYPTELFHDYIENLARSFYDVVRPVIIHALHFETLAELCSILKYEMLDERCNLDPEIYAGFIRVMEELLGDVTERLVYRAQIYARNDIQNFQPSSGDLAYPEKLKMMEEISKSIVDQQQKKSQDEKAAPVATVQRKLSTSSIASSITSQEVASINALSQHVLTAADLHGLWYPTVKRTVLCLSKLFRCLENTVFQSISEEILSMCLHSLLVASEKIANNKGSVNGHLFLIKHLLIIREQTTPFRGSCSITEGSIDLHKVKVRLLWAIECAITRRISEFAIGGPPSSILMDFVGREIKTTAWHEDSVWNLLQQKSRWFSLTNNALLDFLLQAPANVNDCTIDGRRIVDLQLRDACQNLINDCSRDLTKDLDEFLEKAQPLLNQDKAAGAKSLKHQPFAGAPILQDRVSQAYKKLKTSVPPWKALFSIYISNKETENILFSPIRKNVEKAFAVFREIVQKSYDEDEQQIISCASVEEICLLLT